MRTRLCWFRLKAVVLGLSIFMAGPLMTPAPSHAIPNAGDYTFTSGLTGSFTSDGTALTAWNFFDPTNGPGLIWSSSDLNQVAHINNAVGFLASQPNGTFAPPTISLGWSGGEFTAFSPLFSPPTGLIPSQGFQYQSVPEGSSLWMLVPGLLAVLGYNWMRRRQTGVQVA